MSRQEALAEYTAALKRGQKYYKNALAKGTYPYPQVLDEILDERFSAGRIELGLVRIPADLIVGTKSMGRRAAFAGNFMPLLELDSEFATKWITLCEANLGDEGIRDPIRCYEYMGRFYVQEGNKRVSVLKSFDAPHIPGYVTRILPLYSDDPAVQLYYEFVQFYSRCSTYEIRFTRPGSYEKLQRLMGFEPDHVWTQDEQRSFLSLLTRFELIYQKRGGDALPGNVCDALLSSLEVFSFPELKAQSSDELNKSLEGLWPDLKTEAEEKPIALSTAPGGKEPGLVSKLMVAARMDRLRIAFLYAHDPEKSAWTRAHKQGEQALSNALGEKVQVKSYLTLDRNYDQAMNQAVEEGADLIIATTPQMIGACRKIAAKHPKLRVLSCALSQPYAGIRSYYSRSYEAKFIAGAIAGAMAERDRIGYIADYPIVGVPADINAFALGAQMTNPRARIELLWSSQTQDPLAVLLERGLRVISNRDARGEAEGRGSLDWGVYRLQEDGTMQSLALPCWNWGRFYVQVVQSIFNGSWDSLSKGPTPQPVNYWWGMSSGMIDIRLSPELPDGLRRLAEHLMHDLRGSWFDPFGCRITDQNGVLRSDGSHSFSPEELMRMNWLCENVDGRIPALEELLPQAAETASILAIPRNL